MLGEMGYLRLMQYFTYGYHHSIVSAFFGLTRLCELLSISTRLGY